MSDQAAFFFFALLHDTDSSSVETYFYRSRVTSHSTYGGERSTENLINFLDLWKKRCMDRNGGGRGCRGYLALLFRAESSSPARAHRDCRLLLATLEMLHDFGMAALGQCTTR